MKKIIFTSLAACLFVNSFNAQVSYDLNTATPPTSGFGNTAIGGFVLTAVTTGLGNTGTGLACLNWNTSGNNNVANGQDALSINDSGNDNVAVGFQSMFQNINGNNNTGIGTNSLFNNNSGSYNTATGYHSMNSNFYGEGNVSAGAFSLFNNYEGHYNVAAGYEALRDNYLASYNIGVGRQALAKNQTGNLNAVVGDNALPNETNAFENAVVGAQALYNAYNFSGGTHHHSAVGFQALYNNTTGYDNTAVGIKALFYNTTGNFVTGFGAQAGNLGAFTLGSGSTYIGSWTGPTNNSFSNVTALGDGAVVNASNRVWIGDASSTVWSSTSYNISDGRFKKNVKEDDLKGLEFIKLLRPVTYDFDAKKLSAHLTQNMADSCKERHLDKDYSAIEGYRHSGFIAQEVEEAAKKSGYSFSGIYVPNKDNNTDTYGISYSQFVVPLVKAVQEQQIMIEEQKLKNEQLEIQLAEQKQMISDLQQKTATSTGINQTNLGSQDFNMEQNEPNPFNHETVVRYKLPKDVSNAHLNIYDLSGKQLTTLPINQKESSSITISSDNLAAGIYIYSIVADGKVIDSKRMIVANK